MNQVIMHTTALKQCGEQEHTYETGLIPDVKSAELSVINLYPRKIYQTFEGFGAALTESAGYTLMRMSEANRRKVLEAYFGGEGIGYTLGRVHLDSCDFSLSNYCAAGDSDDAGLDGFSLERDARYVQPLIRMAQETLGKPVRLLMSPWSPPAFMKTTGMRNGGGHLKKECYAAYADYIAKYLLEYKKRGFMVEMLTIQNEPLAVQLWDSCEFTSQEEKEFLRDALYPALQKNGLGDVRLFIWDHNKERVYERACEIVDDTTRKMIAGVAYHWYSGDHFDGLRMVREDFPELKLMHSEGCTELAHSCGGEMSHAVQYAHDLIGDLNNGMNSWIDWNLVLDEQGGPNHVDNYCEAPVICDTAADTVAFKPTFYAIAHFSRYIRPGAVRIGSSCFTAALELTAFKNPDGSLAAVLLNPGERTAAQLRLEGNTAKLTVPENSISTILIL